MRFVLILSSLTLLIACQNSNSKKNSFTVQELDEQKVYETLKASEKPYVVLNFFTTYCKPCIKEIPELLKVHQDQKGDASVIFISLDDEMEQKHQLFEKLEDFLHPHGIDFPTFHYNIDHAREFIKKMYPQWNSSIPLNLIFANDGRFVEKTGITDKGDVELIINQDKVFFSQESSP